MDKKNLFSNNALWWVDINILNINNISFKYSLINNIYYVSLNYNYFYYFFLLNYKNLSTLNFYVLDITTFKSININYYYVAYQSIFFDFKILIETQFKNYIDSISKIYNGCIWPEREAREFNNIQYNNLKDTRKLLLNYNYNSELQYNNFNNIVNDLKI